MSPSTQDHNIVIHDADQHDQAGFINPHNDADQHDQAGFINPHNDADQHDQADKCFIWAHHKCDQFVSKQIKPWIIRCKKEEELENKKEGQAYKKLMEDLGEPKKKPNYVKKWMINIVILVVFIVLLITFASIHLPWLVLNKKIESWLALLMVLVSGLPAIRIVTYAISKPFILVWQMNRYLHYFARKIRRCVDVTLWFMLVLWVWFTFFHREIVKDTTGARVLHTEKEEYHRVLKIVVKQITRLLIALTLGALLWTMKNAVFLKLKADLHFKEHCSRIRQTILDFIAIKYIETEKKWEFIPDKTTSNAASEGNGHAPKYMSFWMNVSLLDRETTPIWIIKRLIDVYLEHMMKKPKILCDLEGVDDDEKLMHEAKEMLKKVTGRDDESDITRGDLSKYGLESEEITHVFILFRAKEKKIRSKIVTEEDKKTLTITQDQFLRWTVLALRNCLGLERTLKSSERIFFKLNVLMSSCVVVIVTVIWVLLTEIVTTAQIAILFAPFISASFIFADSMKAAFGGLVFVFGMHPFDVGERVKIDGVEMKVDKMNILTTEFIEYNSGVEVTYPNSDLAQKKVVNLDITPDQPDSIEFTVPIDTKQELISDLQFRIKKTLDDDLTFTSNTTVAKKDIIDQEGKEELRLVVHFKYLVSYLSAETKAQHRSRILCKIMRLRNEMTHEEDEAPFEEQVGILSFMIDAKQKLPDIEELKKKIKEVCCTLKNKGSLKDHSRVVIAGIDKEKITMDVRMTYPKTQDKDNLKLQVEKAIKVKYPKFAQIGIEPHPIDWLPKLDWDDN